jgi:hypothetical protein
MKSHKGTMYGLTEDEVKWWKERSKIKRNKFSIRVDVECDVSRKKEVI